MTEGEIDALLSEKLSMTPFCGQTSINQTTIFKYSIIICDGATRIVLLAAKK